MGSEDIGIDDDDEILDAEIAEVEEEPFIPDEKSVMSPSKAPKPKKRSKKPLLIVSIVFLIIVISIIAYIFLPRPPSSIELHATPSEDGHNLRLNAIVGMDSASEASGTATVKILYDGQEVYKNSNWKFDRNSETLEIPHNEFIIGNGDYMVEIDFEGVSYEVKYVVKFIVEDAEISARDPVLNDVTYQPEFYFKVDIETKDNTLPRSSELRIDEIEHENGADSVTSGIGQWEDLTGNLVYETKLDYEESGNYTAIITIKNSDAKSTSEYSEFEVEGSFFINAIPIAKIIKDDDDGVVSPGTTVHFDGRPSLDDGDNIIEYEWYFEDTKTTVYGAEVDHTFWNPNTTPGADGWWSVTLKVTDSGHGVVSEDHTTWTLIKVS
jgi:hypothetical protein